MKNLLFFDTETSGKCDFKAAPDAAHQPRIVQLAALLCTPDGEEVASLNVLIKPNGWTIPKEAEEIHGISNEQAAECGVPIVDAMRCFLSLARNCGTFSAHNIDFDYRLVKGEAMRALVDLEKWPRPICTMKLMTPVCMLPGNYGSFKWPKLSEAYKHAFNEELEGAHDALVDVRACKRLYLWMKERSLIPESWIKTP